MDYNRIMENNTGTRSKIRHVTSIGLMVLHPLMVYLLFPRFGTAAALEGMVAPIFAGAFLGWRFGVVIVPINALATALIFRQVFHQVSTDGRPKAIVSALVFIALTLLADRIGHVIRQRRALARELAHAKKMEAIGRLAGGVAHDINNTLNAIMGSVFALRQELTSQNRPYPDLDNIAAACDRGADLTRALLGFARKTSYKAHVFSLTEVAQTVQQLLERTRKRTAPIEIEPAGKPPLMVGDRSQMENALMNLCLNALDASADDTPVRITTAHEGNKVLIRVSDQGSGMTPAVKEKLFEPFFTTKPEGAGTGLGMAMVYGVVEAMKGSIDVNTSIGKGTSITLRFPAAKGDVPDRDLTSVIPAPPHQMKKLEGKTVLLVDDEKLVLRAGARMLKTLGCTVLSAESGNEALELYASHREAISFCVIDIVMPGMDGAATLNHLLCLNPNIKVLMVSGYTRDNRHIEPLIQKQPNVRFLAKPYKPEQLVAAISPLLATNSTVPRQSANQA